MTSVEIISLIVTAIGVASFAAIFTILYRNYTVSNIVEINAGKRDIELIDDYIYSGKSATIQRRRVWKAIKTVLFYLLLFLLIPIFVLSLLNKLNGEQTMIGGKGFMVVASGSMSERHEDNTYLDAYSLDNQFNTYDIIILNQVTSASQLKKYDVIAFVNDKGINVIHRIIDLQYTATGVTYVTRGDSNNASDSYHPTFQDVIGVYSGEKIDALGIFVMFFQSYGGMVTVAALVYCLFMLERYNTQADKVQKARIKLLQDAIDIESVECAKDDLQTEFVEKIYYKGYAYYFTEHGFLSKEEILNADALQKSQKTLIKIVETGASTQEKEIAMPHAASEEK